MIVSIEEKNVWESLAPFHDKNIPQSRNKKDLSQSEGHIWKTNRQIIFNGE